MIIEIFPPDEKNKILIEVTNRTEKGRESKFWSGVVTGNDLTGIRDDMVRGVEFLRDAIQAGLLNEVLENE